jgi:hypothetical protein
MEALMNTKTRGFLVAGLAAASMAFAGTANAEFVTNGTFDTDLAGWDQEVGTGTIPTSWVSPGAANVGQPGTPGTSTFSQKLSITSTSVAYSFDYQWQVNKPSLADVFTAIIEYDLQGGGTSSVELVNQPTSEPGLNFNQTYFVAETTALAGIDTAAADNARIIFTLVENNSPVGTRVQLDNVSVSAVPLPAAAWLFGSALVGLVAVARRRRLS